MNSKQKHVLTVFSLTMITVGSVDSIRNLPATALFGSQLIAFFTLGALFFLLPTALVSAELASGWPQQGGIYIWVREAFGKRWGFLAVWLQWIENVIWYPAILSYVVGTVAYLVNPQWANNPLFLWSLIVFSFWAMTLLNFYGMKASALFSSFCTLAGLLLPMTLIIGLGLLWLMQGNPIHIDLSAKALIPNWSDSNLWVSLTAIMLSFCGIEIATVHANDTQNPQKTFPRALGYSVLIILSTLVLGSLAIALVLPKQDINLVAGIMQAFGAFFGRYHLTPILPVIALMLVIGGLGSVSNWIIAPTKGLLIAASENHLPEYLCRINRHGAPSVILILQAIIVTILSTLFLFMPSVNGSYWYLTALATQLYMMMYIIMFITALWLRHYKPNHNRGYVIPGGFWGIWMVAIIGLIGTLTTFFVSFMPPAGINVGSLRQYEGMLALGLLVMCLPPFLVEARKKKRIKNHQL